MQKPALSIIVSFRDRDTERVERWLASLAAQAVQDFEAIFVDYGSSHRLQPRVREIVERHPFCRYVYTDTRGYPWNKAQALNIGARMATADYLMLTDIDLFYAPNFVAAVLEHAAPDRELQCYFHMLPQGFSDWDNIIAYRDKLALDDDALGGCLVVPSRVFHQIRGFDEYYRFWGGQDRDIHARFQAAGLKLTPLNPHTSMFHQWHPIVKHSTIRYPDSYWARQRIYLLRNANKLERNPGDWGRIYRTEDRPVMQFLDWETPGLVGDVVRIDLSPTSTRSIKLFVDAFAELRPGCAMAVDHANYPAPPAWLEWSVNSANKVLGRLRQSVRLTYEPNRMYFFLVDFVELAHDLVADYYLGFPIDDGVSIIMKA